MGASPTWKARWADGGHFFVMLVLTGIVLFAVAVAVSVLTGTDAAAWLEALSTFAAFLAAGVAVRYAFQTWTIEDRREQDRVEADRRSQAALVAGWTLTPVADVDSGLLPRYVARDWRLHLRNAADLPVYGVYVEYLAHLPTVKNRHLSLETLELGSQHLGTLPPGPTPAVVPPEYVRSAFAAGLSDRNLVSPPRITVLLRFRDANEQRWVRDHRGRLVPEDEVS